MFNLKVWTHRLVAAAGTNVTGYTIPSAIRPYYGSNPHSFYLFVGLRAHGSMAHGGMPMHPM